jgi:predicted DNA binding CopG/RHH family protein
MYSHSPYIVVPIKENQFEKFFNKSFNDNILNCLKNEGEYKISNNISNPYDTPIWYVPSEENINDIIRDIKRNSVVKEKIDDLWRQLSSYPDQKAIDILKSEYSKHDSKIDIRFLSMNPLAIDILEIEYNKPDCKIDWKNLSGNPKAINILKKEYVKPNCRISWKELSSNPCAMEILKTEYFKTNCKIIWERFWLNPSIVEIR